VNDTTSDSSTDDDQKHLPRAQNSKKMLHDDADCPRLSGIDTRPVDPANHPNTDHCDFCAGTWTPGGSDLSLSRALRDESVTSVDELRDALGSETA